MEGFAVTPCNEYLYLSCTLLIGQPSFYFVTFGVILFLSTEFIAIDQASLVMLMPFLFTPPFCPPIHCYPLLFYVCFLTPFVYFHFTAYASLSYLSMFVVLSFSLC